MEDENIQIDFDVPTELELAELAVSQMFDPDEDEDDVTPFERINRHAVY